MSTELSQVLRELQRQASQCAWLFQSHKLTVEYRVVYSTGVRYAWRLLENHRDPRAVLRRMHCFERVEALRQWLQERAAWKRQDRALVSANIPGARAALTNPAAKGPTGELALNALRVLHRELAVLDPQRQALREQVCVTQADHVVDLPLTPARTSQPYSQR